MGDDYYVFVWFVFLNCSFSFRVVVSFVCVAWCLFVSLACEGAVRFNFEFDVGEGAWFVFVPFVELLMRICWPGVTMDACNMALSRRLLGALVATVHLFFRATSCFVYAASCDVWFLPVDNHAAVA